MNRLADLLKIHPGEGRLAFLVIGVMALTAAGYSLGNAGIEALFFARFGVQYLPAMVMALAVLNAITSLGLTALLGRLPRGLVYLGLPLLMAGLIALARLLLTFNANSLYPALWLGKEVLNGLIGMLCWGLAGAVCDTRQAKRLFPLFGAGRILGAVLGGLGTGPLVNWLGTENLLWFWAGAMLAAFGLAQAVLRLNAPAVLLRRSRRRTRRPASLLVEMQRGYQFVRASALMRWIAAAAVLFSILYFSIAVPFSRAAAGQYVNEQALAGFLGLFNGLSTAAAFLASLFLANRLYARFGLMTMLLAFPVLYLAGFGVLAVWPAFASVVAFRFTQMVWLSGLADPAYQALFNAVPAERRDQVRAFIGGVPEQTGTFLAGFILLVGERAFPPQQLYLLGLITAAVTTLVLWRAGRAYGHALLDALRAGQPGLFFEAETSFGGARLDASAVRTAVAALRDPEAGLRRVAAEIIGRLPAPGPAATAALVGTLHDPVAEVRVAALRALQRARLAPALLDVAARLADPEPGVRLQAIETLRVLAGYPQGLVLHLQPLLQDPEAAVQAQAAAALLGLGPHPEARDLLRRMAVLGELDERVQALNALAGWGDAEAFALIEAELADTYAPSFARRAAARALAACGSPAAAPLATALADPDQGVRAAAVEALARVGPAALETVLAALDRPAAETGALAALEQLPVHTAAERLARYVDRRLTAAVHYDLLWRDVARQAQDDAARLMADALRDSAQRQALNAMRAIGLVGEREAIFLALAGLESRDPARRANALEALEATRERERLRPFLALWEPAGPEGRPVPLDQHLMDLLESEPDAWIRACAALAAGHSADPAVRATLARRAEADPDPLVRATAHSGLGGPMDTLATLSVMERILFLRRVPLFADLTPTDLQQVAALAAEQVFPDGETLAEQGEAGEEMFIIVSGEVRVLANGAEVARRGHGDVVGEMAIISQEPRMAALVAAGEVRVLGLDQASFEGLLRERPDVSLAVMRVLCARLRQATAR